MTSLLAALAWGALLGAAPPMDLLLEADAQVRGGYSQTPFISSPDAAPLLNTPGTADGQAQYSSIITPGITFNLKRRALTLSLGYQPRLFFDLILTENNPTTFHALNLNVIWGNANFWLLTVGSNVSIGGLNLGQGGQTANAFSGSLRPGTQTNALDFFSAAAFARLEHPFSADWKASTTQTVGKISTPPQSSQNFVSGALVSTTDNGVVVPPLQNQDRLDSAYQLAYKLSGNHTVHADLLLTLVAFPATATYLSYTPSVGWEAQLSRLDKLGVNLGVLKYWTNPFPGRYLNPRYQAVGGVTYEHNFADFDLPRLSGAVELTELPYYDIIYGTIAPRGTLSLLATYQLSRDWKARLQLRDYTQEYWTGTGFLPVPKGRDKNVFIGSAEVSYQFTRWLELRGGLFALNRWLVPSATLPYDMLKEYYAYLSVKGSYDVN